MTNFFFAAIFLICVQSFADNTPTATGTPAKDIGFHDDSELGTAIVSGNTNSETYNAQEMMAYKWEQNIAKISARYLEARANGVQSAQNWDGSLRYERVLSEVFEGFAAHTLDSDVFSGYVQRNSFDLGVKYFLTKSDDTKWWVEGGYRYIFTHYPSSLPDTVNNAVRLYTEIVQNLTKTSSFRFWVEYIPSFTNSQDYLLNTEPSISVMLNDVFSLKAAYLFKYHNFLPSGSLATKYLDTVFTTSLVAKF